MASLWPVCVPARLWCVAVPVGFPRRLIACALRLVHTHTCAASSRFSCAAEWVPAAAAAAAAASTVDADAVAAGPPPLRVEVSSPQFHEDRVYSLTTAPPFVMSLKCVTPARRSWRCRP